MRGEGGEGRVETAGESGQSAAHHPQIYGAILVDSRGGGRSYAGRAELGWRAVCGGREALDRVLMVHPAI